jgi:hypothetical protein
MDKLSTKEQDNIKKMSDSRLISCLSRAGVSPDDIELMDRPTMIDRWARLVLSGADKGPAAAATPSVTTSAFDPTLERERLAFDKQKWEVEMKQRDADKQKWEVEMKQRDAEMKQREADRQADMQRLEHERQQHDAEIQQREADRELDRQKLEAEMQQRDADK